MFSLIKNCLYFAGKFSVMLSSKKLQMGNLFPRFYKALTKYKKLLMNLSNYEAPLIFVYKCQICGLIDFITKLILCLKSDNT